MRFVQQREHRSCKEPEQWEQPWPLPAVETTDIDLESIDEVLREAAE